MRQALARLAKRLARLRLVSAERDLIERLDRVLVLEGSLRFAATSAPSAESARRLVRALERAAPELAHGLRVLEDDRPALLRRTHPLVAKALERAPAPLALAFSWRRGERAPPAKIARLAIGPLLGYPRCCVRFEEARRARIVRAEAQGMLDTWQPGSALDVVVAIEAREPFLADDAGDEEARLARLRRFPFVSFVPCPRCCERGARSPAGRDDARRRALARELSPALEHRIERVRGRHLTM